MQLHIYDADEIIFWFYLSLWDTSVLHVQLGSEYIIVETHVVTTFASASKNIMILIFSFFCIVKVRVSQ